MSQLIAGNWKMNGGAAEADALARALRPGAACDLLVCPPFVHLALVAKILAGSSVGVGGQDCHAALAGPYTGDVSAHMLADIGCSAVILGHSERRQAYGETDAMVSAKASAAAKAGLMPIVCVGETAAQRDAGQEIAVVSRQVEGSLPPGFGGVVAYEPIWAIGTGRTPSLVEVEAVHRAIRAALVAGLGAPGEAIRILYGGSVNAGNAASLLAVPEVGGALVGGASLVPEAFLQIASAAS